MNSKILAFALSAMALVAVILSQPVAACEGDNCPRPGQNPP